MLAGSGPIVGAVSAEVGIVVVETVFGTASRELKFLLTIAIGLPILLLVFVFLGYFNKGGTK